MTSLPPILRRAAVTLLLLAVITMLALSSSGQMTAVRGAALRYHFEPRGFSAVSSDRLASQKYKVEAVAVSSVMGESTSPSYTLIGNNPPAPPPPILLYLPAFIHLNVR